MLNKQENEIMKVIYRLCENKGSCLISPLEILSMLPEKRKYTAEKIDKILRSLELDDYFDLISSDRKGERMYVITLHPSGAAYKRMNEQTRRSVVFKVALSVVCAIITFVVGRILVGIFS